MKIKMLKMISFILKYMQKKSSNVLSSISKHFLTSFIDSAILVQHMVPILLPSWLPIKEIRRVYSTVPYLGERLLWAHFAQAVGLILLHYRFNSIITIIIVEYSIFSQSTRCLFYYFIYVQLLYMYQTQFTNILLPVSPFEARQSKLL